MNVTELESALMELADQLNGDGELRILLKPYLQAGIAYGNSHYYSSGVDEPKDIFWQIAYQIVKDGNIEIEKVYDIFYANVSKNSLKAMANG